MIGALAWAGRGESGPLVHPSDGKKPGRFTIRMPSSDVYLSGLLECDAVVGRGGRIVVFLSDNKGLDWKPVAEITASGSRTIDLGAFVFRRYDYRLAFALHGEGTGLNRLKLRHHIQYSQRALPALRKGANIIAIRSGRPESTVTIEGSLHSAHRDKQLVLAEFRPALAGFHPIKVTYEWLEEGRVKRDVRVVRKSEEQYTIRCTDTPVMRSVSLEWAD